jgi:mono/diheme cytochrome c family protein
MLKTIGASALLALALALGMALAGCRSTAAEAPPPPSPDPVLAELGEDVYLRYCAACHGEGGQGDGPAAGELRTPPADLTRIAARRGGTFPKGEIARFIDGRFAVAAHGTREMPIWGQRLGAQIPEAEISEDVVRGQISVVIEYLESIQLGE